MNWLQGRWQSFQKGVGQWTGLATIWRSVQGTFQQHTAYVKIGLVVLAFALSFWLLWSVLFHFAKTFLMLRSVSSVLGWGFVVLVLVSLVWLVLFVRRTLRSVQESKRQRHGRKSLTDEDDPDPTKTFLEALPMPPMIGLLDLLQPGARMMLETLMFARDPASYEKALQQLDKQEKREGRAPEWILARAQILLHIGRQPQAYRLFQEVKERYPQTRYANDAALLDLAARIEFHQEDLDISQQPQPQQSHSTLEAEINNLPSSGLQSYASPDPYDGVGSQTFVGGLAGPVPLARMKQMVTPESAENQNFSTQVANDASAHPDEDLLASLPSRFDGDEGDHPSLKTMVGYQPDLVQPGELQSMLIPPPTNRPSTSNMSPGTFPSSGVDDALGVSEVFEEEELTGQSPRSPLLQDSHFSLDELDAFSGGLDGLFDESAKGASGRHQRKDDEITALLEEIDASPRFQQSQPPAAPASSPARPVSVGHARSASTRARQAQPARAGRSQQSARSFAEVEAEIDAWLQRNPPMLGGILLEDARQYEKILEQADQLRDAGERQRAEELLKDIRRMTPSSRYAKDAEMRLISDRLFVTGQEYND